jgi:TolB-like protein
MKKFSILTFLIITLFAFTSCSGKGTTTQTFLREGVDLSFITKVAILPFANNTQDDFAAGRVRDITATQIMAKGIFDVVDKGVVDSALREMGIEATTPLDAPLIKRLAQRLNVQCFITGTINSIGENRQGSFTYPEMSFTLQLLDGESALILWRTSDTLNGYSLSDRLFGLDPMDAFQITVELLNTMLTTIPKETK